MLRNRSIYIEAFPLVLNKGGEHYVLNIMLEELRAAFDVHLILTAEHEADVSGLSKRYDLSPGKIICVPCKRRGYLLRKLASRPIPGLRLPEGSLLLVPSPKPIPGFRRQVVFAYDILSFSCPKAFKWYDRAMDRIFWRSIHDLGCGVVALSPRLREELTTLLSIDRKKIQVVDIGIDMASWESFDKNIVKTGRHLMFLSGYQKRKNFEKLVEFFFRYSDRNGQDLKLTIAGPGVGRHFHGVQDKNFQVFDHVDEAQKRELYRSADIYINPSLGEGFGLTNLEAQAAGLIVMANDIPVFQEVMGESAVYFNATSFASFCAVLDSIVDFPDTRRRLLQAGRRNVQKYDLRRNIRNQLIPYLEGFWPSNRDPE